MVISTNISLFQFSYTYILIYDFIRFEYDIW